MQMKKPHVSGMEFLEFRGQECIEMKQGGVDVIYPIPEAKVKGPIKTVLMDLDGTTVKSEEFWIYLIERTVATMLGKDDFKLEEADFPFVSGYTTVEHLSYCKNKYPFAGTLEEALACYHKLARFELSEIMEGRGNVHAFSPRPGLVEFLHALKERGIKIGLATSGLDYKAIPEIVSAFRVTNLGEPLEFYDSVITGGRQKTKGEYGTMGELVSKPHPWIYRELALGLGVKDDGSALVIEDSSAGVISGRLAGFPIIGFKDGNILASALEDYCYSMVDTFDEIIALIDKLS